MTNPQSLVREFHETFNHPTSDTPHSDVELEVQSLRYDLIAEELSELNTAMINRDIVEVADALADIIYVTYGAAEVYGINIQPILEAVHRSNMSKAWPGGEVRYNEHGKVLKGPDYAPPTDDIRRLLKEQAGA